MWLGHVFSYYLSFLTRPNLLLHFIVALLSELRTKKYLKNYFFKKKKKKNLFKKKILNKIKGNAGEL